MEKIIIEGSHKTPHMIADPGNGQIEIKGRSNPENSAEFYQPLINWLDIYLEQNLGGATLTIDLEHFNTSSSKCIMDVLKRLKKLSNNHKSVSITWYYEEDDEEMLEAAETYESMTEMEFKKISKKVPDLPVD
ncbi:MAG: DUF1987 domain-containing protein [Bacteroidales bacterium]